MVYTTEKLTEILVDEFERCASIISDKPQQCRTAFDMEQDAIACNAYQDVMRQIWHYQLQHQISGLIWCEYEYAGHAIIFPKVHEHLVALEGDIDALKAYKQRVIQWWLHIIDDRRIWRDYSEGQRVLSDVRTVLQIAQHVDWAIPMIEDFPIPQITIRLEWGVPEDVVRMDRPASGCAIFRAAAKL